MKEFEVVVRVYILNIISNNSSNIIIIDNYDKYRLRVSKTSLPCCDFLGLFANEFLSEGLYNIQTIVAIILCLKKLFFILLYCYYIL